MSRAKKQLPIKIGMLITFFIGATIALYPFYIDALNNFIDQQRMSYYQEKDEQKNTEQLKEMTKHNAELANSGLSPGTDPFEQEVKAVAQAELLKQHLIGSINIPKISVDLPLFDEVNEEILNYGAGVLQGTSYPTGGSDTHSVISAHSGLPERRLFTDLEELEKDDIFVVTIGDEKLAYQVYQIDIVKPEDTSKIKIIPGQDLVTLLTCTPYMVNTHRLLVTGHRVAYTPEIKEQVASGNQQRTIQALLILVGCLLLLVALIGLLVRTVWWYRLRKRRIDLIARIKDGQGEPIVGLEITLYNKQGRKALRRAGEVYQVASDEEGRIFFEQLPGAMYRLQASSGWQVKAGVKKMKQVPFFSTQANSQVTIAQNNQGFEIIIKN